MLLSASYIDGAKRGIWGEHPSKSGGIVTGEVSAERFISCGGSTDRRLACICDSLRVSITGSQRLDSNGQAGGLFLFVMFIYATRVYSQEDNLVDADGNNVTIFGIGAVAVVGIGSLLFGLVLLAVQWAVSPSYFRGKTLPKRSHGDLLLYPEVPLGVEPIALPDSREDIVIAPDLSNLPAGQRAIDPETGEIFEKPPD